MGPAPMFRHGSDSLVTLPRSPMPTTLHIVDAFTSQPFAGNPAAVCVLTQPADETWMQLVA